MIGNYWSEDAATSPQTGVGGEKHLVVTQALEVVLNVERAHEIVHLVVLVNDVTLEVPHVERLALEREHGLVIHGAAPRD
jgi:hypothetical protein